MKEIGEMNGTMRRLLGRSVQLAVMATPTTSVEHAVAEARRRHESAVAMIRQAGQVMIGSQAPAAGPA